MAKRLEVFEIHCKGMQYAVKYGLEYKGFEEYKGSRTEIHLRCGVCNLVWKTTTICNLSKSKGCKDCHKKEVVKSISDTLGNFIRKAVNVHGDTYDYSNITTYKNAHERLNIICRIHGSFLQNANNHLSGKGCPVCAKYKRIKSKSVKFEDFVERANIVHNSAYKYVEQSYTKGKNKLEIICSTHGIFKQQGFNHLQGNGCPKCAPYGYNVSKPANLYCTVWMQGNNSFVKVGISNNPSYERINRQANKTKYLPYITHTYKHMYGSFILSLEKEIKASFTSGVVPKKEFPDGYTETFNLKDYKDIVSLIKTRMENNSYGELK